MGIPAHLMPQTFTRVRPATTVDRYNNTVADYGVAASRVTDIPGWLEQTSGTEPAEAGRDPLQRTWLLITNYTDVLGRDRIEVGALAFDVEGPPQPVYTPAGLHHYEIQLRVTEG